ncbi:MAG: tetratricopeptide repeat protein [Anaerolineae bacterium]|nr:tetratricopeptide repeat protein [Anaerolineae bacterium]
MLDDGETVTNILRKDEGLIDLAATALLIAEHLTHPFNKQLYLNRLDKMAAALRPRVAAADSQEEIIDALNTFLFGQIRLSGNADDYYNPNNSFLNRVLDTRKGIPILLSVIYLEIGHRLHLPLWGVSLPGHFITAYGAENAPIFIDVFNRGRILTEDDCLEIARIPADSRATFRKQYLRPVSKKHILYRMLLNLKHIYLDQHNWANALKTMNLLMILRPKETGNLRDRGLIYHRLGRYHAAITDLQRYLFLNPNIVDAKDIKERLELIETELARLN